MALIEIKRVNQKFVDLNLSMAKHPVTKDVAKRTNENAVIASIKNILLTRKYDRPFHPELSSQIQDLLFEPLTPATSESLKRVIQYAIENFEPRVELLMLDVNDNPDFTSVIVTAAFRIIGSVEIVNTSFTLKRSL